MGVTMITPTLTVLYGDQARYDSVTEVYEGGNDDIQVPLVDRLV
jgi:hypothetical protein